MTNIKRNERKAMNYPNSTSSGNSKFFFFAGGPASTTEAVTSSTEKDSEKAESPEKKKTIDTEKTKPTAEPTTPKPATQKDQN